MGKVKHGGAFAGRVAPEYRCLRKAIERCHDPNNADFHTYGARGIAVCEEWRRDFGAFLAHIGPRPSPGHSIDRIDNARGYEPGNVRWATPREQARNTRRNHLVTIGGETHPLCVWLERYGTNRKRYCMRISLGWSVIEAITLPCIPHARRHMSKGGATQPAAH